MGGGSSKPQPPPTIIEQPPPGGSGQGNVVYPNNPTTPRLDGVSRALADECDRCMLQIANGASSSSVKIAREYGTVTFNQCKRFTDDSTSVAQKKMSKRDWLNNLRDGMYYRDLGNGYCENITISNETYQAALAGGDVQGKDMNSVRILKQAGSGGFSAETKVRVIPSIPFRLRFSAAGGAPTEIPVNSMSVYHPCPLRLEGEQPDAVLSLNDPSFDNPNYVILIPLVGRNVPDPSVKFMEKILPQVVAVSQPDPASGQYIGKDVPTGVNWTLNNLLATTAGPDNSLEVASGYYEWKGMPTLERVRDQQGNTITYSWKESGTPSPHYIMLDKAVACNPADLAILTQRIPITPPADAIHAVLYSTTIGRRGIVHKMGPPDSATCSTRESFTPLRGVTETTCDPWTIWAQTADGKGFTQQQILGMLFNVLVGIAMGLGAFIALAAVLRMYDVEYADFAKGVGKVTAVFLKNFKEKVASAKQKITGLRSMATGAAKGPAGLASLADAKAPGGLAALTDMKAPGGLAALTNGKAPGGLAALTDGVAPGGLAALTGPGSLLSDVAEGPSPADRLAAARAEQTAELNRPIPRVRRTRRANIPLGQTLVGPESVDIRATPKKKWNVNMDYLTGQGPNKRFTRRGGRTHTRS